MEKLDTQGSGRNSAVSTESHCCTGAGRAPEGTNNLPIADLLGGQACLLAVCFLVETNFGKCCVCVRVFKNSSPKVCACFLKTHFRKVLMNCSFRPWAPSQPCADTRSRPPLLRRQRSDALQHCTKRPRSVAFAAMVGDFMYQHMAARALTGETNNSSTPFGNEFLKTGAHFRR